jgi:hypothetical protein
MSEIREDFCGICAVIPVALAGLGATSYVSTGAEYKNRKMIIIVGSAIFVVLSIIVLMKYWKCSSCSPK